MMRHPSNRRKGAFRRTRTTYRPGALAGVLAVLILAGATAAFLAWALPHPADPKNAPSAALFGLAPLLGCAALFSAVPSASHERAFRSLALAVFPAIGVFLFAVLLNLRYEGACALGAATGSLLGAVLGCALRDAAAGGSREGILGRGRRKTA